MPSPKLVKAAAALSRIVATASKNQTGQGTAYTTTRSKFSNGIADAVNKFMTGQGTASSTLNQAKRIVAANYLRAAEQGLRDGAGTRVDMSDDDEAELETEQDAEFDYLDGLWSDLVDIRSKRGQVPQSRINQYTNSLDSLYNTFKLRGADNPLLEFAGHDGNESCSTCQSLHGRRMRAQDWIDAGLIPGGANENYECNGYNCNHFLRNVATKKRFTI